MEKIKSLMNRIGVSEEAQSDVLNSYQCLSEKGDIKELKETSKKIMEDFNKEEYLLFLGRINAADNKSKVHPYMVACIFILLCATYLENLFVKRGIDKKIYIDSISDIWCKMEECKKLYNVWGIFASTWFWGLFAMEIFKLGRLQFQTAHVWFDECETINVKQGDNALFIHIPSDGALSPEEVVASLKDAYAFFECKGNVPFFLHSWLTQPGNENIFPKGSNLRWLYEQFTIFKFEDDNFRDCWRIFNVEYNGNPDSLPQETRLQKNIVSYLKNGGRMGCGYGVLLFDGKNIFKPEIC
ncbi:MAG: DUF5596 domain-containing protein [Clostridia bacterium]|nr:DUF5596 domain-containing protein [Clostridia bacterium]